MVVDSLFTPSDNTSTKASGANIAIIASGGRMMGEAERRLDQWIEEHRSGWCWQSRNAITPVSNRPDAIQL